MNITDFRKRIFDVADWMKTASFPIDIQKNNEIVFRIVPKPLVNEETPAQRAEYLLKYVLPKLKGMWKDVPQSEFDKVNERIRGKKALNYMRRLRKPWNK